MATEDYTDDYLREEREAQALRLTDLHPALGNVATMLWYWDAYIFGPEDLPQGNTYCDNRLARK